MRSRSKVIVDQRGILARLILPIFAFAVLAISSGCGAEEKKAAQDLVKSGNNTADKLANYYSGLAQKRADYLTYYKFDLKRTGAPVPAKLEKDFHEQQDALEARAQTARKLKALYDSLGKLIEYDASTEISKAAGDLKTQLESVTGKKLKGIVPGFSEIDPSEYLDKAIKAISEWAQLRQVRKNSSQPQVVLISIRQLFQAEMPLYVQIAQDFNKETYQIDRYNYMNGQATSLSSFQKPLEAGGLQASTSYYQDQLALELELYRLKREKAIYDAARVKTGPDPANLIKEVTRRQTAAQNINAWNLDRLNEMWVRNNSAAQEEAEERLRDLFSLEGKHRDFIYGKKPAEK